MSGTVRSTDGTPLPGAVLDIWQTASNGMYAVQDHDQPEGNLRGRFRSGPDGSYAFRTTRPVSYSIPDDGPVGRLLRACGRHPWRASHIHAIVSADGHVPVTTHIFDRENEYLESDTVFGVKESLIEDFVPQPDGSFAGAPRLRPPPHPWLSRPARRPPTTPSATFARSRLARTAATSRSAGFAGRRVARGADAAIP